MRKLFNAVLIALLLSSIPARAGDDYGWRFASVTVDLFIARPFTFVVSIVGATLWTVALPITAPTHTSKEAFETLVQTPWDLTFDRSLGDYGDD